MNETTIEGKRRKKKEGKKRREIVEKEDAFSVE